MQPRWDDEVDAAPRTTKAAPHKPVCDLHRHKKVYNSAHAADRALQAVRDYGAARDKKPTRVYPCPGCKKFFLTSQPR